MIKKKIILNSIRILVLEFLKINKQNNNFNLLFNHKSSSLKTFIQNFIIKLHTLLNELQEKSYNKMS